jgi:hypothetical protein
MVTLTAAIERIPTDCNEGTYSVPASTNCCRPFRPPLTPSAYVKKPMTLDPTEGYLPASRLCQANG